MKVPNTPGSGKCIAKAKGVRGDAESEGRWRQISGPTNRNRIRQALRIRLHDKSKSNCQDKDRTKKFSNTEFDFLGYTFRKVLIKDRLGRLQMNFIASVSKRAEQTLKDKVKSLELHKRSGSKLEMIAESLNPILRGWMNYFGRFNRSAMKRALDCVQRRLIKWAMCKYKNFRGHRRRAEEWLNLVRKREPSMFAHWALGKSS